MGTISAELGVSLTELLTDLGMTDDLLEVTSRLTDLHPRCARLWLTRMSQEMKHAGKGVEQLLNEALRKVPAESLWANHPPCQVISVVLCKNLDLWLPSRCQMDVARTANAQLTPTE
ncbi:hypothetical protein RRG08_008292 [Elysia crispata]|uniref:Uncharacterized protein n=1 Tax=Elysia crispata TaxID=231223 RepID=A0AAE0ZM84_9GAST|nr:hypothetical protein RRG08_008292 [Elysia crispata]